MERLSTEELCAYLEEKGVVREDLNVIRDCGFNGRNISTLRKNYYESLYGLGLKLASNLVLMSLLGPLSDFPDAPGASGEQGCPSGCKRLDIFNDMAHKAKNNEYQKYSAYGLGRGVDASEPSLFRDSIGLRRVVREVQAHNCERGARKKKQKYEEVIGSMKKRSHFIKCSAADLVDKVLTFSIGGEYTRHGTMKMMATGERVITGSISFRSPLKHRCTSGLDTPGTANTSFQFPESSGGRHAYESNFEHEFCKWLLKELPDINSQEGSTLEDKVEEYISLCNSQEKLHSILEKAYGYIRDQKITHYISAINLGACKYSVGFSKTCSSVKEAKADLGQDLIGGAGAGTESRQEEEHDKRNDLCIGDIDDVEGKGESVVGYGLLPLFCLVCSKHKKIKKVLQMAICYYLHKREGPFTISCIKQDQSEDMYWKVDTRDGKNVVVGTRRKDEASIFYIEEQVGPREFSIVYCGEKLSQTTMSKCKHAQHLSALSKMMGGRDPGPLQIGGGRAANLTLRHAMSSKEELTIDFWEKNACFIKLAPRPMQKKSYIAFDMQQNKTLVVSCREQDGSSCCMTFGLNRVEIGSCPTQSKIFAGSDDQTQSRVLADSDEQEEEGLVFGVPAGRSESEPGGSGVTGEGACRAACDGGSEEVTEWSDEGEGSDSDYEFEFGQRVSDSDDD